MLSFKDDVTTFKVPLVGFLFFLPSLFVNRDVIAKQDATDASIFTYVDDIVLKEPIKTESNDDNVEHYLHDDGDITSVDSSGAKLEKDYTPRRFND